MSDFTRAFALTDIRIRSGGDGRTVEAYAAVFDTPTEIQDREGHYNEQIARSAFNKTLADRGDKPWPVLFNHGLTVHGTPSDRGSYPIGASIEPPKPDGIGVRTVSRYHAGEDADRVLEGINSGAINAQSFSGRFIGSTPKAGRNGYRPASDGTLTLVTRNEVRMLEYGPAVFAAYPSAAITGVRAQFSITPADKALLTMLLANLAEGDAAIDPIVAQAQMILSVDSAFDTVQFYLAQLLGVPDPDPDDDNDVLLAVVGSPDRAQVLARLTALATRLGPADGTHTPPGAVAPAARISATARLALRQKGLIAS